MSNVILEVVWFDEVVRIGGALLIAAVVALAGYMGAALRHAKKRETERDSKLDKLVQYHEGIPADDFLGLPAVPGINDKMSRQEIVNQELSDRQKIIIDMVHTGNGKTIGQKVDEIEKMAAKALTQGSSALDAVREIRATDKEMSECIEVVKERLDEADEERREIMIQSLEGWQKFASLLNIEPGDPPWIEWTKKKPKKRRHDDQEEG